VRARALRGAVPQGYISGTQAAAACAEAGKRLCTDAEWLRACRGPANASVYPYGNTRQPGVCNDARPVHPAVELYGTGAAWIYSHIDSPCLNQLDAGLARTGSHSGCLSADGLFDLMGNLHEWTADPAGTFRGGYYVDTKLNGEGCLYVTTAHDVSHWDYSTGFRCCGG
jgi:formylglycine-generating enzyme required for sulfatase activity